MAVRPEEFSASELDLSNVPGVVEIKNNGKKRRMLNISGMNQSFPIEPNQTIKIMANTSSELLGYLSQEDEDIEVKLPEGE